MFNAMTFYRLAFQHVDVYEHSSSQRIYPQKCTMILMKYQRNVVP